MSEDRQTFVANSPRFGAAAEAPPAPSDADEYARVEIFGHRLHFGRILDVDRFGAKFIRVDIPTDGDFDKGYTTVVYGGSAIFSITPTTRAEVERFNGRSHPIGLLTSQSSDEASDDDDDDHDGFGG